MNLFTYNSISHNFSILEINDKYIGIGGVSMPGYCTFPKGTPANYANIGDNLFANKDWLSKPQYTGYAIGYGLESVIGPIEIKYSWSPEIRSGFTYVSVGFWF